MSYWSSRGISVDSFDGYDPTPYSGGYDLSLTYGRPLQPSDEICYPVSAAGDVDFERPHYSSGSQTSAFEADNAKKSDFYGFQLQPHSVSNTGYPGYGHQSLSHGGGGGEFDYGSVYGGRPQLPDYGSAYGQGYGQHPQLQEFRSEYGSEYESGVKPYYGSGHGLEGSKHYGDEGYGASGYRRSEGDSYGRQGFAGNEYRRNEEEVGRDGGYKKNSDYVFGGNTSYVRPSYGVGEDQSARFRTSGYGVEGSVGYKNSNYGDEYQSTGYRNLSYSGGQEGEGYGRSNYGNDSDDVEKKHSHLKHHHHRHY